MTNSTDKEEIQSTISNVSHFIDQKQWSGLRALYAETVQTDYTSLFGGQALAQRGDALVETWRKLLAPIVTQHILGPITVDAQGDSAIAQCHVRGYHYVKGAAGGDEWIVAGHYVFQLSREMAFWKITSMKLETFYQSGNTKLLEVAGGK